MSGLFRPAISLILLAVSLLAPAFSSPGCREDIGANIKTAGPSSSPATSPGPPPVWVSIPGVVDGLTSYGLFWTTPRPTGRAVILIYGGWGESVSRLDTNGVAAPLVQALISSGYSVLALDQRGSEGHGWAYQRLADIGTEELFDVISAALWLQADSAPGVLFLVGLSHGGSLALRAAEEFPNYGIPVDGVLAFGPITDYEAWKEWACFGFSHSRCSLLKSFSVEQRFQGSPIHFVPKNRWPYSFFMPDSLCPVFLVCGTLDSTVPPYQAREWLWVDRDAILLEQPVEHGGLINDDSMKKSLAWMDRISMKRRWPGEGVFDTLKAAAKLVLQSRR